MSRRNLLLTAVAAAMLAVGARAALRLNFHWRALGFELRTLSLPHVAAGIALIYASFFARGVRWSLLMGPAPDKSAAAVVAPQFIGFSAVALFGRLADLTRPYLIARRSGLTVASQVAVYSVERLLDLAAAAILFSTTLALAPRNLPHHATYAHAGLLSLTGTALLAAFALCLRFFGSSVADFTRGLLASFSPAFAESAADRILDFQRGLLAIRSLPAFAGSMGLSLVLWLAIALAYLTSCHAFTHTPQLMSLSFTQTMLLMATSMGGSLVQLPVVGWFTQVGLLAAALHGFFAIPAEAGLACGTVLLCVNTLSIVPAGLAAAWLSGTSLRGAAKSQGEAAKRRGEAAKRQD